MCDPVEQQKRNVCKWYLVLSFLVSFVAVYFVLDENVAFILLTAVVAGTWCRLDADQRNFRLSRPLFWGILLIYIVFVPVYLIKTRQAGGFMAIAKALVLFFIAMLIAWCGGILAWKLRYE